MTSDAPANDAERSVVFTQAVSESRAWLMHCGRVAMLSRQSPAKSTVNEDACAVVPVDADRCVLVVADGCGGMARGELAAQLAVNAVCQSLRQLTAADSLRTAILDAIETANRQVLDQKIGAATTLAIVEVDGGRIRTYHIGDSQILLIGGRGKIKLATVAHSPVGFAERAGILSEAEAMNHDDRHVVSNVVGCDEMKIEIGPSKQLAARDTLILSTDGLFDNLSSERIARIACSGSVEDVAASLASEVDAFITEENNGKPDDLALIVFRLPTASRCDM